MRHSKSIAVVSAVIAAVLTCAVAQAGDVYKYVDERGVTLYTDKPMPGAVLVSTGTQRPPEVAARANAANQAATNNQLAASNQRIANANDNTRVAASVAKDLEATRVERCKKAREDYTKSINSPRMYRQGPDGQRTYLSDAELAQARVNGKMAVEGVCGPQG